MDMPQAQKLRMSQVRSTYFEFNNTESQEMTLLVEHSPRMQKEPVQSPDSMFRTNKQSWGWWGALAISALGR